MIKSYSWRLFLSLHKGEIVESAYRSLLGRECDDTGLGEYKEALARSHDISDLLSGLVNSDEFRDNDVASLAPDLVRAAYLALLGREPDTRTSASCCATLSEKRELHATLASVIHSNGLYDEIMPLLAPDLVGAVYRGLLGRQPDPEAETAYSAEYPEIRTLPDFLSKVIASDEFWKRIVASRASDMVRSACLGLLGQTSDPEAEATYRGAFFENPELSALLDDIIRSDKFWKRTIALRAPDLVRAAYQGLLEREPEWEARAACSAKLSETTDLPGFLAGVANSNEFWEKTIALRAPDLVRTAFQGVLGRQPDKEALRSYSAKLAKDRNLLSLLAEIAGSDELWQKVVADRAPDLVRAIYQLLLGRAPDNEGLASYAGLLRESPDLDAVLLPILNSDEFCKAYTKMKNWPNPAEKYNDPCLVLLHIQRTGGTSLNNHLRECYGMDHYYREHTDSLHMHPPGELCNYDIFAGHFNYDSLEFIPRKKLSIFTFVREPKERLISLYHFLRLHEPGSTLFDEGMKMANRLMIEEFFEDRQVRAGAGYWNHMTWAIMGERQWLEWRACLTTGPGSPEINGSEINRIVEFEIRPAIEKRLREFVFIGLLEDFGRSVELLFQTLGQSRPTEILTYHSLELLAQKGAGFKTKIERQPSTPRLDAALDGLVQLDNIVYEESTRLFKETVASGQSPVNSGQ